MLSHVSKHPHTMSDASCQSENSSPWEFMLIEDYLSHFAVGDVLDI